MNISADPNDPEVQAIAAFLRVLNALENIRSSINVAERGRTMSSVADLRDLAGLSLAETIDAMEVLSEGALARSRRACHSVGPGQIAAARVALEVAQHLRVRWAIDDLLNVALQHLRAARSALANPATLPPPSAIEAVPRSGCHVPGSCSGFRFAVQGSGFRVPAQSAALDAVLAEPLSVASCFW